METDNTNNTDFRYTQGRSAFPPVTPVGMAYVPFQKFQTVYDAQAGFAAGTIFPELDMPWLGGRSLSLRQGSTDKKMPGMTAENDIFFKPAMMPENPGGAKMNPSGMNSKGNDENG